MSSNKLSSVNRPESLLEMAESDIDVTPIMNMFIILMPFLMTMAVFTHFSILSLQLPPNVNSGLDSSSGKPVKKITVVIAPQYLALTYGDAMLDSIPLKDGNYDFKTFEISLSQRKNSADIRDEAIVAVKDKVKFQYIVKVMDICKAEGFSKLGVSSATENAETGV
jgi:biopolymer transport protein ExbD